jgi:hypothetical protein
LSRSTIFSGIDSIGPFHVIELKDKDKAKTAFATLWGSYQFVRMPFGLAGGPSSYACLVHMVLDSIPYTQALPYLDDTFIHSKDLAGHFLALDRVLEAYKKAGLKLQPAKCQLFQREIKYLGHMVSVKGIAPVLGYVQVVKDWHMPTNRSEVRTLLSKTGYYRRLKENYAEVAGPLTDILDQEGTDHRAPFDHTSQRIKYFKQLKSDLLCSPILAYTPGSTRSSRSSWTWTGDRDAHQSPDLRRIVPYTEAKKRELSVLNLGPRLFDLLPSALRQMEDVNLLGFKKKLDNWLANVLDQPTVRGLC